MRIPLSGPDITETEINAVVSVLGTPRLSLGPKLIEFEATVAEYCGTQHAVAVNSGTSGLHLCVRALGIGEGDEVITTSFSFIASANALLYERARPVFVDIDPLTMNIDPSRIRDAITPRTKAIMLVHAFGRPAPVSEILEIAGEHDLALIEDSCEAIGAEYEGRRAGSFGNAGVLAFYPNKQITTGEGGMILTDNSRLAAACRRMRNQGRDPDGNWLEHTELGYNYRISDINCALGIEQMNRLGSILERRAEIARRYSTALSACPALILPGQAASGIKISWFVYVVRLAEGFSREDRDWLIRELTARGIGCQRYFAPIHLQPLYRRLFGYGEGDLPVTESIGCRTIALPFFNRISDEQVDEVCRTLIELVTKVKELRIKLGT
ncbi:MAG TPA: DegT/DnrJ/EryC1/StrS family aminotransferase [Blastocatellia bacterium]|nr:DegT/DnrJ/EryC1/StrS family aminotransferase [Blastocatellia bacterium]